jgi:hypothetical protein
VSAASHWLRRAMLPTAVFAAVIAAHVVYRGLFPERDPAQDRWAAPLASASSTWMDTYVRSEAYWNGISYAIPLAFAAAMYRRYRERRMRSDRTLALGGLTISGVMSVVGCFLVGCCGSPMLAVYLGLFGAAFQPFAKPLSAIISAGSVALAWLWMRRRERRLTLLQAACPATASCACAPGCAVAAPESEAAAYADRGSDRIQPILARKANR